MNKFTRWFTPEEPPRRKGWYETYTLDRPQNIIRLWWDGALWKVSKKSPPYAVVWQQRFWRGLSHPA